MQNTYIITTVNISVSTEKEPLFPAVDNQEYKAKNIYSHHCQHLFLYRALIFCGRQSAYTKQHVHDHCPHLFSHRKEPLFPAADDQSYKEHYHHSQHVFLHRKEPSFSVVDNQSYSQNNILANVIICLKLNSTTV